MLGKTITSDALPPTPTRPNTIGAPGAASSPRRRYISSAISPSTSGSLLGRSFLGTRSRGLKFPTGDIPESPSRSHRPNAEQVLCNVEPMSATQKYLLTYYLAFDEFSAAEGELVLQKVLEEFLKRGSISLEEYAHRQAAVADAGIKTKSQQGTTPEKAGNGENIDEKGKKGTKKELRVAEAIWASVHRHCESSFMLNRFTSRERNLMPFPNELCAAVCCDALVKVSNLFAEQCGVGRLMEVIKLGIFSCVYRDYDPSKWFFELTPFFDSVEALAVENSQMTRKLSNALGQDGKVGPVERAVRTVGGFSTAHFRQFGHLLFAERPDVNLLQRLVGSLTARQQRLLFEQLIPHCQQQHQQHLSISSDSDEEKKSTSGSGSIRSGFNDDDDDGDGENTNLHAEQLRWLTGLVIERLAADERDNLFATVSDSLKDEHDASLLFRHLIERFPHLGRLFPTFSGSNSSPVRRWSARSKIKRRVTSDSSIDDSVLDEGIASTEENIVYKDPLSVANEALAAHIQAQMSDSEPQPGDERPQTAILKLSSRRCAVINSPSSIKQSPSSSAEGLGEANEVKVTERTRDEGVGSGADFDEVLVMHWNSTVAEDQNNQAEVEALGGISDGDKEEDTYIIVRVVSLLQFPESQETWSMRVPMTTTVPQIRARIANTALAEQGSFSLIHTETGTELGLAAAVGGAETSPLTTEKNEEINEGEKYEVTLGEIIKTQSVSSADDNWQLQNTGGETMKGWYKNHKGRSSQKTPVLPLMLCKSLKAPEGHHFAPQENLAGAIKVCTDHRETMLDYLHDGFENLSSGEIDALSTAARQIEGLKSLPPLMAEQAIRYRDDLLSLLLTSDQARLAGLTTIAHPQQNEVLLKQRHRHLADMASGPSTDNLDGGRPTAEQQAAIEAARHRAVETLETALEELVDAEDDELAQQEKEATEAVLHALDNAARALKELDEATILWEENPNSAHYHIEKDKAEVKAEEALREAERMGYMAGVRDAHGWWDSHLWSQFEIEDALCLHQDLARASKRSATNDGGSVEVKVPLAANSYGAEKEGRHRQLHLYCCRRCGDISVIPPGGNEDSVAQDGMNGFEETAFIYSSQGSLLHTNEEAEEEDNSPNAEFMNGEEEAKNSMPSAAAVKGASDKKHMRRRRGHLTKRRRHSAARKYSKRMVRLVSRFPRVFADMFSKPFPSLGGVPLPLRLTVKLIEQIYLDKIHEDRVNDARQRPRTELSLFVYQFFLNKYGLRALAEQHLIKLIDSLIRYSDINPTVQAMARFMHIYDRLESLGVDVLNVYLDALGESFRPSASVTQ